jgi:thiol-disulfide isomerase/thioredoxin
VEEGEVELRGRHRLPAISRSAGLILILVLALLHPGCERTSDPARVEPALAAADLDALRARLAPGGAVRVVNFWATWCQPCVEELPEFIALDAAHRERGIQVIGISMDLALTGDRATIESRVSDFLRKRGIGYENLLYTGNVTDLLDELDLPGSIPYTLVIGTSGEVLWRHEGKTTRERVEAALNEHAETKG